MRFQWTLDIHELDKYERKLKCLPSHNRYGSVDRKEFGFESKLRINSLTVQISNTALQFRFGSDSVFKHVRVCGTLWVNLQCIYQANA